MMFTLGRETSARFEVVSGDICGLDLPLRSSVRSFCNSRNPRSQRSRAYVPIERAQ